MANSSRTESLTDDLSLEEVQELVRTGEVDVKETGCDGNNILHKVCSLNTEKSDVVEYLISVGAVVNQVNSEGCTPLIVCASKGYSDTLRVLLKQGACVDLGGPLKRKNTYAGPYLPYRYECRDSALFTAAQNGHEECVNELIKHDSNIWNKNKEGQNLLMLACSKGLASVVKHCIEHGSERQINEMHRGLSSLVHWFKHGDINVTGLLTEISCITQSLFVSVEGKHEDCVLELLSHGAAISSKNIKGKSLLIVASEKGLVKVVRECLKVEVETDELNESLVLACENMQNECLQELLSFTKRSACSDKVSEFGLKAFLACAKKGFIEGLKLLIQFKRDLDATFSVCDSYYLKGTNQDGESALLLAAASKHEECVKILIDHGADIWYKNNEGENLLMLACEQGLLNTVKYCLSRGSFLQITEYDCEGNTALLYAYRSNQVTCMKELLQKGDEEGWNDHLMLLKGTYSRGSLLHLACSNNIERPDIVEIIISHSNVIDIENENGYTALMLSAENGYLETAKLLIKFGASVNLVQHHSPNNCSPNTYFHREYRDSPVRDSAVLMAAKANCQLIALELIDKGADIWHVNNQGESLLTLSAGYGHLMAVKECLFRIDRNEVTSESSCGSNTRIEHVNKALHAALKNGHEACALEIIAHGGDVWYSDKYGKNALMLAAENGLVNVVKTCVSKGSPEHINRRDNSGNVAVIIALQKDQYDCAREIPKCEHLTPTDVKSLNELLRKCQDESKNIEDLVFHGASVNSEVYGQNHLNRCSEQNYVQSLRTLIRLGADVNNAGSDARGSNLFTAAQRGHERCALELISHGADITWENERGKTVLMVAAEEGLLSTVRKCLEMGSESYVNMTDNEGKTAVLYACAARQTACLEELLKNPKCFLGESRDLAMNACARYGFSEGKELLTLYRAGRNILLDNKDERDLLFSVERCDGYNKCLLDQIQPSVDIWYKNSNGQNLLMKTAHLGLVQVVRHCLAKATFEQIHQSDREGKTAIMLACSNLATISQSRWDKKDFACLLEILKCDETFSKQSVNEYTDIDAKIYAENKSLMEIFCCKREADMADVVQLLVHKGAAVNEFSADGFTPLMLCALNGHTRSLDVLIKAGADVNQTNELAVNVVKSGDHPKIQVISRQWMFEIQHKDVDSGGNSSLLLAAQKGQERCVFQLISQGVDIWCCNNKGENLFMLASATGLWKVVQYCLGHGSDEQINKLDSNGNNAVIHACKNSQVNTLLLLLSNVKCSGQIHVISEELDMTSLMLAVCNKSMDVTRMLLNKGAEANQRNKEGLTSLLIALGKVPQQCSKEYKESKIFNCVAESGELVKLLIRYGASVHHVATQSQESVLIVAIAEQASLAFIEQVLSQGVDVNHADKNGKTALSYACERNMSEGDIVKLLLRHGASLTLNPISFAVDEDLWTSRHKWTFKLLVLGGLQTDKVKKSLTGKDGVIPKLYDMCRIPARQHVMNSFPNSNLFHTIPRLILPQKMKNFLLYNYNIINKDDDGKIRDFDILIDGLESSDEDSNYYNYYDDDDDDYHINNNDHFYNGGDDYYD